MESNKKDYSPFDIELDSLAMERAKLNNEMKELKKKLDNVNEKIKEKLGSLEDYTTEYYHFIYKLVYKPEYVVKENITRPLIVK